MTALEDRADAAPSGMHNPRPLDGYLVGWFHWDLQTDAWTWSDGMYQIHALDPEYTEPSLGLLLEHKHPDDRARVEAILATAQVDGDPFSYRHRLVDADGREHTLITAGEGDLNADGRVVALHGSLVDVTETVAEGAQELAQQVFTQAVEHRAAIEQAKGCLMIAYGLTEAEAFALLRRHSQQSNTKLNEVAARLVEFVSDPARSDQTARRKITEALTSISGRGNVLQPDNRSPQV